MNYLTRADLCDISGLVRPSAIRRWLDGARVPYMTGADAWPRVSRAVIDARLETKTSSATPAPRLRLRNG